MFNFLRDLLEFFVFSVMSVNIFKAPLSQHENTVCVWFLYFFICNNLSSFLLILFYFGWPWAVFLYISWHFEISPFLFVLFLAAFCMFIFYDEVTVGVHAWVWVYVWKHVHVCHFKLFFFMRKRWFPSPKITMSAILLYVFCPANHGWLGIENQFPFLAKKWLAFVFCQPLCLHYCSIINKQIPCLSVVCK